MGDEHRNRGSGEANTGPSIDRRHLLGVLAAAGVAGCGGGGSDATPSDGGGGNVGAPAEWPSVDDPYYDGLVSTLSGEMGLSPAEFVYADNEADTMDAYTVNGSAAETSDLDVSSDDVPFANAVRVDVTEETENPWNVTVRADVQDRAVSTGDVLLAVVYLRGPEESESQPTAQFLAKDEDNESTNMVMSQAQVAPGPEWQRYYFPIQFDYDSEAGTWWTEIFLGFGVQVVDLGGIAVLDFGQGQSVDALPSVDGDGGRETASGDWEAAADERIQQHRTADLQVSVTDADGNPVDGAEVRVDMQEHEFGFGTAVNADELINGSGEGDDYRTTITDLFNTAVLENQHKWRFWERNTALADDAVDWAKAQGLTLRGHVCLWGSIDGYAVPNDVVSAMGVEWDGGGVTDPELDPEHVRQRTMEHIPAIVDHYGEDIDEWEVVNEVIHQPGLIKAVNGVRATEDETLEDVDPVEAPILGEWYDTAREAVPDGVTVAMNDYSTLAGPYPATRNQYERQVEFLADGHGLDSVGLQCHFSQGETLTPSQIMEGLDRYAQHDVRLRVTEFDMAGSGWPAQDKADFLYEFLKTVFSHPAVDDFLVWGFWDGRHWQDDAPFFTQEWEEKPALEAYRSLVFREWWTDVMGTTDDDGGFETTGFKGEYEVRTTIDGETVSETVTLSDGGATVELSPA